MVVEADDVERHALSAETRVIRAEVVVEVARREPLDGWVLALSADTQVIRAGVVVVVARH